MIQAAHDVSRPADAVARAWSILDTVEDPEIPVISVVDLGVVRAVEMTDGHLQVTLTPTYTGCPANEAIQQSVREALAENGFADAVIRSTISPPWSTDWITDAGKEKLLAYGIVPPSRSSDAKRVLLDDGIGVPCPRCASTDTEMLSVFGSTPCKSLLRCRSCLEPFERFKCI